MSHCFVRPGALCQRTGFRYTAVVVAVGCMPGRGLGGIWMCTLYYYWLCVFNVWTLVLTGSGTGSVILDFAGRWVWGRGPRGVVPGQLGGRSGEWMPAVFMFSSVQFSSVQLISGRRLRGLPLCPDLRRSMRLIGHMGLSYDRIGRGGLSSACPIVAWMRWRLLP